MGNVTGESPPNKHRFDEVVDEIRSDQILGNKKHGARLASYIKANAT
jgi:hypothetical protein